MAYQPGNKLSGRAVGRAMQDLEDFLVWHIGRTKRTTGRAPAKSTMDTMSYRVRQAASIAGATTLRELAEHLEQPHLAEAILDKLAVTNSTGSLRHTWGACSTSPSMRRSGAG